MEYIRRLTMLAKYQFTGNINRYVSTLTRCQWMSEAEVEALQRTRLRRVLRHAWQSVPFYRRRMDAAALMDSKGEVRLERFTELPFLTREDLRHSASDLIAQDATSRKMFWNASGGSTGEPVRFVQDKDFNDWVRASKILYDSWTGYRVGQRQVRLWGSERDLFVGRETLATRMRHRWKNELRLNAFRMSRAAMPEHIRAINEFRPRQVLAYADAIYELARFGETNALEVWTPDAIMTSATPLYEHMRATIESFFGAPVYNRYGSRELGDVACQCEKRAGLHVNCMTHLVEIVDDGNTVHDSGRSGEVVVTSLCNYSMPLIRYKVGDLASWTEEACRCGRVWPTLENIEGRSGDTFKTLDGGVLSPTYLIHLVGVVCDSRWIDRFQIIQEALDEITVLIVPSGQNRDEAHTIPVINELEAKIRLVMGPSCRVNVEFVSSIPLTQSGKHRYTISKLEN